MSVPPEREEVIVAFPSPRDAIPRATAYRSTWIVSSLQTLRERGHFETYKRELTAHHDAILGAIAGSWMPMEIARAHYDACDHLGLDVDEQVAIGESVGMRAQGTLLSTAARTARG